MPPDYRSPLERVILLLATGLGTGFAPKAPGTFGSLLALPLAWGMQQLPIAWQYVAAAAVVVLGIPICDRGAKLLGAKDPGAVVFDEIAAIVVVFLFVPFSLATAIAGFVLFRLLDITKPWPLSALEKLPGGLGIMADDLAAGVFTGAALWCVARFGSLG